VFAPVATGCCYRCRPRFPIDSNSPPMDPHRSRGKPREVWALGPAGLERPRPPGDRHKRNP
jgi:hypothetical protein